MELLLEGISFAVIPRSVVYTGTIVAKFENRSVLMVGVSIDITERKQLERDLINVLRRSAMGEMATAIAHEINQPLAAMPLFLDGGIALLSPDSRAPLVQSLNLAKDKCLRTGESIRRLRSFVLGSDDVMLE